MNFNDSFGEIDPKNDKENEKENNINIISIEKGDIGDIEDESKKNNEYNKEILNTSFSNNNNIFSSLPLEMEIDNEYAYSNDIYDTLLSKELLKYNISNLLNILKQLGTENEIERLDQTVYTVVLTLLRKQQNFKVFPISQQVLQSDYMTWCFHGTPHPIPWNTGNDKSEGYLFGKLEKLYKV